MGTGAAVWRLSRAQRRRREPPLEPGVTGRPVGVRDAGVHSAIASGDGKDTMPLLTVCSRDGTYMVATPCAADRRAASSTPAGTEDVGYGRRPLGDRSCANADRAGGSIAPGKP